MKALALLACALILGAAPVFAQDALQLANERMEMRAFGDAFKFIKQDIQQNPRSWRGYHMLGQYYLRGLTQADNAITAWLKAWGFAIGRTRIGAEHEEFRQLGESLTQAILDKVNVAGEGGPKILEQALIEYNFVSLPLIRAMCDRFVSLQKWGAIRKVMQIVGKSRPEDFYRRNESELAWLDYYEGRAMAAQSDVANGFAKLTLAQNKGITEAAQEITRLGSVLDATALSGLAEASAAYEARNYIKAKEAYKALLNRLPEGLPSRQRALTGLQNAEAAIGIEAALQAVEASRKKGDFSGAVVLINAALQKFPADARLQEQLGQMQKIRDELTERASKQADAHEKAQSEASTKRQSLIMEAQDLRSKGKFQEAGDKYKQAQAIRKTEDVTRVLGDLEKQYEVESNFEQGKNSFAKRDWAGVLTSLGKVIEGDSTYHEREVLKMTAIAYFELHQFEKGRDIADKMLAHNEDAELLRKMADLSEGNHESRVEMARAIQYLERLARVDSDPAIRARIADLNWELDRPKYLALGLLLAIWVGGFIFMKKKPDWSKRIGLGDLERFVNKKKWREATDLHGSLLKMQLSESEEIAARHLFARAFFESGNYVKSISECQHVLRVIPENKQLKVLLARSLYATKNISPENLQYFLELMETDPQNKDLLTFVGQFALKKKLVTPMTLPILRHLATLMPEDDGLRLLLIKGYLKDNDRSAQATALYEVERQKNPKNIDVRVILAEDYLRKGEVTRAIQECEEIINIDLNHARTHEILARAYAKLGKTADLIALYQSLLEADPHNGAIVNFLGKLNAGEADRAASAENSRAVEAPSSDTESSPAPESGPTVSGSLQRSVREPSGRVSRAPTAERSRGAPASIEAQRAMFSQGAAPDVAEAPVTETAKPARKPQVACRKCGKEVLPGSYFCACGAPL